MTTATKILSSRIDLAEYFNDGLLNSKAYHIDAIPNISFKLDQNENPFPIDEGTKKAVLSKLETLEWQRYPAPYPVELDQAIASFYGVHADQVLTANGANLILNILLGALGRKRSNPFVLAEPSFPLYAEFCRYENIPYQRWSMTQSFAFDVSALPKLEPGQTLVFASPNNPTGGSLTRRDLADILTIYPKNLVIADQAYAEFSSEDYLSLLDDFPNLIIVRTFSKVMAAAGVRLGFMLAHPEIVEQIRKVRLPYLLNHFSLVFATTLLTNPDFVLQMGERVRTLIRERERMQAFIRRYTSINPDQGPETFASDANFFLLRWPTRELCQDAYERFKKAGILVRDVSKGPQLANCLRVSVGIPAANDAFLAVLATTR